MRWCNDNYSSETEVCKDLLDALEGALDFDGYEIAKRLESRYWETDRELVDILDEAWDFAEEAYKEVIRDWRRAYQVKPKYKIGDHVAVRAGNPPSIRDGEIEAVNEVRAQYCVYIPSLGHVREGVGTHGIMMDWESVP